MSSESEMVTDEMLSAYIDGELDREASQALAKRIARDPALRARVEDLQRSDELMRAAFDPVSGEPVPPRLMAPLRAAQRRARFTLLSPGRPAVRKPDPWRLPIAASVALAAGIAAGVLLMPGTGGPGTEFTAFAQPVSRQSALYGALERIPSDAVHRTRSGAIAPVRTVRTADGRFCREFESTLDAAPVRGVACREPAGNWHLQAVAALPSGAQGLDYRPAAGSGANKGSALLDSLLDGRPLDLQEEQELIAKGWTGGE